MPRPFRTPRKSFDVLEACSKAAEMLRRAGFELRSTSMRTEACYYGFPGREALLRVAVHSSRKTMIGLGYVAARLTFRGNGFVPAGTISCSEEKFETMVALAIGRYFLNCDNAKPSRYTGKRIAPTIEARRAETPQAAPGEARERDGEAGAP